MRASVLLAALLALQGATLALARPSGEEGGSAGSVKSHFRRARGDAAMCSFPCLRQAEGLACTLGSGA